MLRDGRYLKPKVERIMLALARGDAVKEIAIFFEVSEAYVLYVAARTGFHGDEIGGDKRRILRFMEHYPGFEKMLKVISEANPLIGSEAKKILVEDTLETSHDDYTSMSFSYRPRFRIREKETTVESKYRLVPETRHCPSDIRRCLQA